jgi:hypothetical protein
MESECPASPPGCFNPTGSRCHKLNRSLFGPGSRSGHFMPGNNTSSLPEIETRFVGQLGRLVNNRLRYSGSNHTQTKISIKVKVKVSWYMTPCPLPHGYHVWEDCIAYICRFLLHNITPQGRVILKFTLVNI